MITNDRIKVRIDEDKKYVIRSLYRKGIDIYEINNDIYTIDSENFEKLPFNNVELISQKGIKGIYFRIKLHKHFLISILISIVVMLTLSNVVFKIDIIHSDREIRNLLESELEKNGIHPFMFKKSFNKLQKIKEKIKNDHPDKLEWFEIIDEGMRYTVRVEERIITEKKDTPKYCDIVSTKDAMVLGVVSSNGQNIVGPNEYVKKGSTLVSGAIKFKEETKSYTCASATVYGNTWYTLSISVPYEYIDKTYTGRTAKNIAFLYGSKLTEIFNVHLDRYDTEQTPLFSFGNFTLLKEKHREYKTKKDNYTEEEALNKALELARKKLKTNLSKTASILSEKVLQTNAYDSIIEVDIFYSVKEEIGKQIEKEIPKEQEGVKDDDPTSRILYDN